MEDRRARLEKMYDESIDPWDFRTSSYEREKYKATVDALPRDHYDCCIEAGCSIGELSRILSERCDRLYGLDLSQKAIDAAIARNADRPNLEFRCAELPADWPSVMADLLVFSEVLYFMTTDELADLARKIEPTWSPGGDCLIVSFLGKTDEPLQGAESADFMISALQETTHAKLIFTRSMERYRLDILRRGT